MILLDSRPAVRTKHTDNRLLQSTRKPTSAGVVAKSCADIHQLSLPMHTGHLAQTEVNQSSMELTISRILELTYLSSQLKMLAWFVTLLYHDNAVVDTWLELVSRCKHTSLICYQLYCNELIHHLQLKVAELQQLILVSSILQLLLQTVVFCFQFLYLIEICKFRICVTVTRNIEYLVSSSWGSIGSAKSKL